MSPRFPDDRLSVLARETVARINVPAVGLAIAGGEGTTCAWSGVRMLGGPEPLPDDVLRIASVTKSVTAVTTWSLVERGHIDPDAHISSYLEGQWIDLLGERRCSRICIEHLLRHTSGLSDYVTDTDYKQRVLADPTRHWTPEEQVAYALQHAPDVGEPGEVYHYSDTGYVVLAQVLETAGQAPLHILARRHAGYHDLPSFFWESFEPPPAGKERVHQYVSGIDATDNDPSADLYGGGGLVASLPDLATWFRRVATGEILSGAVMSAWVGYEGPGRAEGHFGGLSSFDLGHGHHLIGHRGYWGVAAGFLEGSDVAVVAAVTEADNLDRLITEVLPTLVDQIGSRL
ncbi:MAG: beta-lactamase family protein [Actinobacteria bacterium]|nr:beta-lactamase family protein [Actinomycetota bacterium]